MSFEQNFESRFRRPSLHNDYFRDDKNRIAQVLTWHHPKDKRLSIIKYDLGDGYWTSRETGLTYRRILKSYSLKGQVDNLSIVRSIEPSYIYRSFVFGVDFVAVPVERIKQYYYPEDRLKEIFDLASEEKIDAIEFKVLKLAQLIHDCLKVPFEDMGITGSILWKGQTAKSDIDFVIYGNENAKNVCNNFQRIYDACPEITPMPSEKRKRYEESMAKKSGLPTTLTKKYIALKKWLSIFGQTDLSLCFSPKVSEIPFKYGEQIFSPIKPVEIECVISNADLGYAYPSIYEITDCKFLKKPSIPFDLSLERVLSFEGALTGFFSEGNEVVIHGLLEGVKDKRNNLSFNQIILGTRECLGKEFILFKEDYSSFFFKNSSRHS